MARPPAPPLPPARRRKRRWSRRRSARPARLPPARCRSPVSCARRPTVAAIAPGGDIRGQRRSVRLSWTDGGQWGRGRCRAASPSGLRARSCAAAWAPSRTSPSRSRPSASWPAASPRCSSESAAVGGAAAGVVWPIGVRVLAGRRAVHGAGRVRVSDRRRPLPLGGRSWAARGWGWATAWFNLGGLVFVTAAVNVGTYQLFVGVVGPLLGIDPATLGPRRTRSRASPLITPSHGAAQSLRHPGDHAADRLQRLPDPGRGAALTVAMLHGAPGPAPGRLITFANTAAPAGGGVWPPRAACLVMTLLALMWPVYTSPASTPRRTPPRRRCSAAQQRAARHRCAPSCCRACWAG